MDIQLKRGILEVCVLSALLSADSYGYQIIKDVSPYLTISESTLYPILRRLESAGCLTTYSLEHSSRLRKYYSITTLGLKKIETFADLHTVINLLTDTEEALQAVTDMYDGEFCDECVGPCYVQ